MKAVSPPPVPTADDAALLTLLGQHYGDGLVYLTGPADREVLRIARAAGLVSAEGYLTRAGHTWLASAGSQCAVPTAEPPARPRDDLLGE